jgi:hypothetical protein
MLAGEPCLAIRPIIEGLRGKQAFDPERLRCVFCLKVGHVVGFCPLRPTKPEQGQENAFADGLISSKRVSAGDACSLQAWLELGAKLNAENPWGASASALDKVRGKLGYWKALGADATVLSWLAYGIPLRFHTEPPKMFFKNHRSYYEHYEFSSKELSTHLEDGRFSRLRAEEVGVCSPQMVHVNAKSKKRRCDDLRYVNAYLAHVNIRLEGLREHVPDTVASGDLTFVYDLEKAYYSLSMAPGARKWLCFHDRAHGYVQLNTLPFGLAPAVMFFTKICRPVLAFLRRLGLKVINLLDDWLGSADAASVRQAQLVMRTVLETLGWVISKKSSDPALVTLFLGLLIDSQAYQFQVPAEKVARGKALVLLLRDLASVGKEVKVKDLQILTGFCASMFLAIPCLRVYTRAMYASIAWALDAGTRQTVLGVAAISELSEVLTALQCNNGAPIRDLSRPNEALYVDAGESGFGLLSGDSAWYGPLPEDAIGKSSA